MSDEDENFLILICKFKTEDQIAVLDDFLRLHLTRHFIPNQIVSIPFDLPLTTNGKIDRSQLFKIYSTYKDKTILVNVSEIWKVNI